MSITLMTAAFKLTLPTTQKFVFVALCDNASDEGVCFPSITTLCKKTSLKERSVQKSIQFLLEKGFLQARRRTGKSTVYSVLPSDLWPVEFLAGEESIQPPHDMHPCTTCTPASDAPHPRTTCTPPPHDMHPTPARRAPITIIEPSYNNQGTVRECAREPEKPEKQPKHKTRLSENWFLPQDWGSWALGQGLTESEIRAEAECFGDYWRSKGETRADWYATWRNWIRRKRTFEKKPSQNGSKKSIYEQNREAGARAKKLIFGDAA